MVSFDGGADGLDDGTLVDGRAVGLEDGSLVGLATGCPEGLHEG